MAFGSARVLTPVPLFPRSALIGLGILGLGSVAIGLAFVPPVLAAGLVVGLLVGLLILIRPVIGLYLLAFAIPFGSLAEVRIGGVGLDPSLAVGLLTAFAWLAHLARERLTPSERPVTTAFFLPLAGWILYVGVLALSVPDASTLGPGVKEVAKWLGFGMVFVLTDRLLDRAGRVNRLLIVLLVAGSAEALVGWAQFLLRLGPEGFQLGRFVRAYGTYGQPNPFAGYLNTIWPLAYVVALAQFQVQSSRFKEPSPFNVGPGPWNLLSWRIVLGIAPVVVIGLAIGMSFSRGAWLAMVAGLLVTNLLLGPRVRAWTVVAALVGALVLLGGASNLLPATVSERIVTAAQNFAIFDARSVRLTPENWAIVERMATWQAGWDMFLDYPVLGVGAGNFDTAYETYHLKGWQQPRGHAHNVYLNALAETGLLGLASYLLFLGGAFGLLGFGLYRRWTTAHGPWTASARRSSIVHRPSFTRPSWRGIGGDQATPEGSLIAPPRWLVIALLSSLTSLTVHNVLDNLYVHGTTMQLGLLLGLASAVIPRRSAGDEVTA